jgi:dolichyl-phosphate mannosyltransferase polypeptide 3
MRCEVAQAQGKRNTASADLRHRNQGTAKLAIRRPLDNRQQIEQLHYFSGKHLTFKPQNTQTPRNLPIMTRAQQTITAFVLLATVCLKALPHYQPRASSLTLDPQLYMSAFLGFIPLPATIQEDVVPVVSVMADPVQDCDPDRLLQIPFWAIVSFGAYLLAKLGYGVFSFNDVPEAHEELVKQIDQARADLSKRGVSVD